MSSILDSVDQRTRLVGQNRLELLLFRLGKNQLFAINVFKVREVLKLPKLNILPNSNQFIVGVCNMRGITVPVIDLSWAIGMGRTPINEQSHMVISEYNGSIQGFMVSDVERILNLDWANVMPPPTTAGRAHYLTAITRLDDNSLVEIVDVEKVLSEISPFSTEIAAELMNEKLNSIANGKEILVVDDSQTARDQIRKTLAHLGIKITEAVNGTDGLQQLRDFASMGSITEKFFMIITDAEMPEMDGYRLTTEIRNDPDLKDLYIILHTSLSGNFNKAMVQKVGCDDFLPKFEANRLAEKVLERVKEVYHVEV